MKSQKNSLQFYYLLLLGSILCSVFYSCTPKEQRNPAIINLKWNKAHEGDSLYNNIAGLKWTISFLGSNIALDTTLTGITHTDSIISLDVTKVGFTPKASRYLKLLNTKIQASEEYQIKENIDLGRYMALTIGSPNHYYKIVDIPLTLAELEAQQLLGLLKGYVNNSGVSKIHREIQFSNGKGFKKVFISAEKDSVKGAIHEFETVQQMPNGLSKFALYDANGNLKPAADPTKTRAGKPAKCMWCHEASIQPMFKAQLDVDGYITFNEFLDTLKRNNRELKVFQKSIWQDSLIIKRKLHTQMEIAYISFMEPNIEQLSREWGISKERVREKIGHLKTHIHHEFEFLGELYHRKEVDHLGPFRALEVSWSIREESGNEVNYLE